jgi:hypothetical protein
MNLDLVIVLPELTQVMPSKNFCLCGHAREDHEKWYDLSANRMDTTGPCTRLLYDVGCPCKGFVRPSKKRINSSFAELK